MVESNNEVSRDLEKALQALEQAKHRVANEKKKKNGTSRYTSSVAAISTAFFVIPKYGSSSSEKY